MDSHKTSKLTMIGREHNGLAPERHLKAHTRDRMQGVEEVELSSPNLNRLTYLHRPKGVDRLEEVGVQTRQGGVLAQEAVVDGLRGHQGDAAFLEDLLEGACIVVCMAVGDDDAVDECGGDVRL